MASIGGAGVIFMALICRGYAFSFSGSRLPLSTFRETEHLRMSSVEDAFESVFSKVNKALELQPLDHAEAMDCDKWTVGDFSGTVEGFKGKKVDWVSKCITTGAGGSSKLSLRAWVMPMYDVPHLSITLEKGPEGLAAEMDLVAKDDLMYSKTYREQYYGTDITTWWSSILSSPKVTAKPVSMNIRERVMASPVQCSVTLPDDEDASALLEKAADDLVEQWLGYLDEATEIPRVRRGVMLSRDSELRRNYWFSTSSDPALGSRGPEIAAAMAGPGDQGYTGQAS
ncbi:unnamed protein product [Discosporangium mesarthrocarpum]